MMLPQMPNLSSPHVRFTLRRGTLTYNGATPWNALLGVGSPVQMLRVMVDTGTLNTWLTGSACTTVACQAHRSFNPEASTTWEWVDPGPKSVDFGPWGTMEVATGRDRCTLDLVRGEARCRVPLAEPCTVEVATRYDGIQFQQLDCDGGLAVPSVPDQQCTALLDALKAEGHIQHRVASFDTDAASEEGVCLLGAVDPSRFAAGSEAFLPLVPPPPGLEYLWCVHLESLSVEGVSVLSGIPFCLDTGSSCFKGSSATIAALRAVVTGDGARPDVVQDASQLDGYPMLALHLGGKISCLAPSEYFVQLSSNAWVLGFQVLHGLPDAFLLVGSLFLDKVYAVFDMDRQGVMLAKPLPWTSQPCGALTGSWKNEFGSVLEVGAVAHDGTFRGTYRSETGASGIYPVVGVVDPFPLEDGQAVAFSVSWRSCEGSFDPSWHWVSAFAGVLSGGPGKEVLRTQYLLQQDPSAAPAWMGTAVFPSTFSRV